MGTGRKEFAFHAFCRTRPDDINALLKKRAEGDDHRPDIISRIYYPQKEKAYAAGREPAGFCGGMADIG